MTVDRTTRKQEPEEDADELQPGLEAGSEEQNGSLLRFSAISFHSTVQAEARPRMRPLPYYPGL